MFSLSFLKKKKEGLERIMNEFKDLLKAARKKKKITQKEVAELIGLGRNNYTVYQKWEYGIGMPSSIYLLKLIKVLDIDPNEIKY